MFSKFFDKTKKKQDSGLQSQQADRKKKKQAKSKKRSEDPHLPKSSLGKRQRPSRDEMTPKKTRPSKKKRTQPSGEALKLSERLKELSRQKKLDEALKVYFDKSNDRILDGHHACIIIDCCARCGSIAEGEKIVENMKKAGVHVNVETKTALLKGYAHSGQMAKGEALFESMCSAKSKADRPNVRTLNTLLRGCMWSSVSVDKNGIVSGGVSTAEKVWIICKEHQSEMFDVSSYEYSISLLCQAFRTDEGKCRISEMQRAFNVTDDLAGASQSVTESLSIAYLALARAHAILNQEEEVISACKRCLDCVKASRRSLKSGTDASTSLHGKRAWKKQEIDGCDNRRAESNTIFREHRLTEVETEANVIVEIVRQTDASTIARQLARRLLTRLIVLSGGGTTAIENHGEKGTQGDGKSGRGELAKATQSQIFNTVYFSYGLQHVLEKIDTQIISPGDSKAVRRRDCNRVLGCVGLQGGIVGADGVIDFHKIFNAGIGKNAGGKKHSKKKRPLEIELGAGFGDWIVQKALETPSTNFLSVELRADRVGQTFARTAIMAGCNPVDNLCVVGAEGRSFLQDHVQAESASKIYINHPEPPTQTFGAESGNLQSIMEGSIEPGHMVSSGTIVAAAKCLLKSPESRLVIVTDNRWYGRLICATMVKVNRENKGLLHQVDLTKMNSTVRAIESFGTSTEEKVHLFEGKPDGNLDRTTMSTGVSYFDRLWRSGAGAHAERSARFIICMARSRSV